MKFSKWRIVSLSVLCILLAPFVVAEETLLAKVYRDYPGHIESPTCQMPEKFLSLLSNLLRGIILLK